MSEKSLIVFQFYLISSLYFFLFSPNLFEGLCNKRVIENISIYLKTVLVTSIKKRVTSRFLWIILQYQTVF